MTKAKVIAVSKSGAHTFNKFTRKEITLIKGLGVEGDAHMGAKVKHKFLVRKDPNQPNLRQVHLMHAELFDELENKGFKKIHPGEMGENITTLGIDLLSLPQNTILAIGEDVLSVIIFKVMLKVFVPCRSIKSLASFDFFRINIILATFISLTSLIHQHYSVNYPSA